MFGHYDVAEDLELVSAACSLQRVEEDVFRGGGVQVGSAVVATEGDEVVVAFLLVSLEAQRHGLILGYRVRALRECPTSQNRDMGHPICGSSIRCGPPVLNEPIH